MQKPPSRWLLFCRSSFRMRYRFGCAKGSVKRRSLHFASVEMTRDFSEALRVAGDGGFAAVLTHLRL
jgi:hypothetical protein